MILRDKIVAYQEKMAWKTLRFLIESFAFAGQPFGRV